MNTTKTAPVAKKRKKSEYDRMYQKCKAYFQPVGELENSLMEIITKESLRCRALGRQTDAAEENLEHTVMVFKKVQSLRTEQCGGAAPDMQIQ